jgi:hypothetical protein
VLLINEAKAAGVGRCNAGSGESGEKVASFHAIFDATRWPRVDWN